MGRNYKLWSEKEEARLIDLYNAGLTNKEICEQLNRDFNSIKHRVALLKQRELIIGKRRTKSTESNYCGNAARIIDKFYKKKPKELSQENYKLIIKRDQTNQADGLTKTSQSHHIRYLEAFAKILGKTSFINSSLSRDIKPYLIVRQKELKESGYRTLKSILKLFYKELMENHPGKLNLIKIYNFLNKRSRGKRRTAEDTEKDHLSRREIVKLVAAIKGKDPYAIRNRALIATTYDSGARISELLAVRVKDSKVDDRVPKVYLPISKTKPRNSNMLNFSLPYLLEWIKNHEYWNNEDAPLFYSMSSANYGDPLSVSSARQILIRALKISGIKKKITLHSLRHSKAFHCAQEGMMVSEANSLFGWSKTSGMFHYYSTIKDKELEVRELERANKLTPEQIEGRKLERNAFVMKKCGRCKEKVLPNQFVCPRCGLSTSKEISSQELDQYKEMRQRLVELEKRIYTEKLKKTIAKKITKKKVR